MPCPISRLALQLLGLTTLCASSAIPNDAAVAVQATGGGTSPPCSTVVSVQNGDFETGALGPWTVFTEDTTAGSSATVVSPGDSSGYAVQLVVVGDNNYLTDATIIQTIPLCTATNYSITFDYKVVSVGTNCGLSVVAQSGFANTASSSYAGRFTTPGDWATATFYYPNYVRGEIYLTAGVECDGVNQTAVGLVDNFQIATVGTLEPADCPARAVEIANGDFESGALAPWYFHIPTPQYSIVSPGYNSNYALQIDVPTNTAYTTLEQRVVDDTCLAYNYTFTFAVNWGNYSFVSNKKTDGCRLEVLPFYCSGVTGGGPYYYPTPPNSGWNEVAFTCTAGNSKGLHSFVELVCLIDAGQSGIPPFALQLDSFTVQPTSPNG